jgi:DinB family protein
MPDTITATPDAAQRAGAYIASLRAALGSRDAMEVLREMPAELERAIADLSPAALNTREAPGKWSVNQVVQHLADAELVSAYRYRMTLTHERPLLIGYDQDLWADRLRYDEADVHAALDTLVALRVGTLRLLERASPRDLLRAGVHSERGEESVADMVANHAGHDIVHLRQIARIRRAVGGAASPDR